ncbi:MAG TPA: hypothetical protein DEB06_05015, partial [Phycisphaerales bacterium]|nr:hypothetical protein [Phycisphaerales bacterium]
GRPRAGGKGKAHQIIIAIARHTNVPLRRTRLVEHAANPTLGLFELLLHALHDAPPSVRRCCFPRRELASFRICQSSVRSAAGGPRDSRRRWIRFRGAGHMLVLRVKGEAE